MIVERPFRIFNATGDLIRGDFRFLDGGLRRPLVLICHGFNTNKDWGPFPYLGRRLAEAGFATFVFNFSHNGVGNDSAVFSEYDRFSKNTPGKELGDVQAVLDAFTSGDVGEGVVDVKRIGMAGHSRGGGISVLTAARDERVRAVVAWSTISAFLRYTPEDRERWVKRGYLPLRYGPSRTLLRYEVSVLYDLEQNSDRYDLFRAVRELKIPTLFIHGSGDEIVSSEEARSIYEVSDKALTEFVLLEGAGHTYGVRHPFAGTTPETELMLEKTKQWFHTTLTEETP